MSKSTGNDEQCVAWLNKAEEYFDIYNITIDIEKVKYASMHLENHAYNWYMWWKGDNFTYTWNLFKNDFLKRFQESIKRNFSRRLLGYSKKEMPKNSHTNGNHSLPEYLG